MAISFNQIGSFNTAAGGGNLSNPTSIQFGPDGRLYVSEQNGTINAFTVELQNGQYVATAQEELELANGLDVVKSILNHNDDGSANTSVTDRQVTGVLVTGTAENPVLYISSSDPRIAESQNLQGFDSGLDTNSGVLTRVTWNGTDWEAVDLIRGLPRSEENHSVNGMTLSDDGTKLYLQVGGNTNNGAPSAFFTYTAEYALSGTLLEIDLTALDLLPVLTDPNGGQNGSSRDYVYDLPTLDDPNIANDGVQEDVNGLDVNGPWGGNDGLNQAILPADAPIRIFADGFRNQYDVVLTQSGQLYTFDNGSNTNLGGDPLTDINGEAINTPVNGGQGEPDALFLIEDGDYYGTPNPVRSNQDQSWTVYDDSGNPDTSLAVNFVPDISALVPAGVNIQSGFLIDPSKFTSDPNRLLESGVRVPKDAPNSLAIATIGSSSNGLVEYTSDAFDGALQGALIVASFNGNINVLKLDAAGTGLEAIIDPGDDEILGTADDVVFDADGVAPVISGLSLPLDITTGPDGTLWVVSIGGGVQVFEPSISGGGVDDDIDNDGLLNVVDPFTRDAANGLTVAVAPGGTYVWDFDPNQDGNLPGPSGYGGGLTGVMIDGTTDFEQFFQEPSTIPGQDINLDNIKFITAAGGGTTVVEFVSNGDATGATNSGEYLLHTGVRFAANVDTATIKWTLSNPGDAFIGSSQQIGAYIGTGDQSNYLKVVAIAGSTGEIQFVLEDNDVIVSQGFLQADDLFTNILETDNKPILIELTIDFAAETVTPVITYENALGQLLTVNGTPISITGTALLDAIEGNYTVGGQTTGVAVGLYSSNVGQLAADTFQAIFDEIEITATGVSQPPVANDDMIFVSSSDPLTIQVADLLANDSDPDVDDQLSITSVSNAQNGTAVLDNNGTLFDTSDDFITFTPSAGFDSTASFDYTLSDQAGETDNATVNIVLGQDVVLYRVNSGGDHITAIDGDIDWAADTAANNNPNLIEPGSNHTSTYPAVEPGAGVPATTPGTIFDTERADFNGGEEMQYAFNVADGTYEVRLYMGNGFFGTSQPGTRVFDVAIEGNVLSNLDDIDLSGQFGHLTGTMISNVVNVTDGALNIEFLHGIENPLINGIEIIGIGLPIDPVISVSGDQTVSETDGQVSVSFLSNFSIPAGESVDVTFDITPINATVQSDYDYASPTATFNSGTGVYTDTVTLAAGTNAAAILIDLIDDPDIEPNEAFTVTITNLVGNATIGTASSSITIESDEVAPTPAISIVSGDQTVSETDGQVQISILSDITVPATETVDVTIEIAPVNATVQSDYDYSSPSATFDGGTGIYTDTLSIAGGSSDLTLFVDILNDAMVESDETFTVTITDVSANAVIGATDSSTITIQSEDLPPQPGDVLYRVNAGGEEIASIDSGINWAADTDTANNPNLIDPGSNSTGTYPSVEPDGNVPATTPGTIFDTERADFNGGTEMQYAFDVANGDYEVRLYMGNGFFGTSEPGTRIFDVALEGNVLPNLDDIDLSGQLGHLTGSMFSNVVTVTDGTLNIEFLHGAIENPLVNGIEIIAVAPQQTPVVSISGDQTVAETGGQVTIDLLSDIAIPTGETVDVTFTITPVSATAQSDYEYTSATASFDGGTGVYTDTVSITEGLTSTSVLIHILDDLDVEPDETFTIDITGVSANATLGTTTTSTVTIQSEDVPPTPVITISGDQIVSETGGQVSLDLLSDITIPTGQPVDVTFTITPVSATAQSDYEYTSATASFDGGTGVYTDTLTIAEGQTSTSVLIDILDDLDVEPDETFTIDITGVSANATLGATTTSTVTIQSEDGVVGAATLGITQNSNNVQTSNFGNNSFLITNTGDKDIVKVEIDVTNALFPDAVFDPFGEAGDTTSKQLSIDTEGATGIIAPDHGTSTNPGTAYVGVGGIQGFEGIQLFFDGDTDGGFNPGETIGFSIDMDPNSVAGALKSILDSGADPTWDIGGISGAELLGSSFIVTFEDGSTAIGQLNGNNNQAGAIGLATQDAPPPATVALTVNGLAEGGVGTYTDGGPTVIVNGPAGETARIVLTKGIIQPVNNNFSEPYASQLQAQLDALAASDFPANNAAEFQTVDILLTGSDQDISSLFDFTQVPNFELAVNEAQVPLGFVASLIDTSNGDLPIGPVSQPIYLQFAGNQPPVAVDDSGTTDENTTTTIDVLTNDSDPEQDPLTITEIDGNAAVVGTAITLLSGATVTLNANGTLDYDPNGAFSALNDGEVGNDSFTYTIADGNGGESTATVDVTVNGVTNPVLTLSIDPSSISENGGTATGTVTRNGDTSSDLIVTLSSDDTTEATVPPTVTILSGQASATFTVTGVDDLDVDGTQTPTITATAAGFPDATATVDVTDDDVLPNDDIVVGIYDAQTDQLIIEIVDGQTVPEALIPAGPVTISATVPATSQYFGQVESMRLDLNSGQVTRVESVEPYALFGDSSGNFFGQSGILPNGPHAIAFELFDANGANGTLLTTITVNFAVGDGPINTPPVAVDNLVTTDEDTFINGNVLTNDFDPDGDNLTVIEVNGNAADIGQNINLLSGATLTLNANGTFTYDPNGAFESLNDGEFASDGFTYTISDGNGGEDTANVDITIDGVTDPVVPVLSLNITPGSISENGGTATGTVTRTGDTSSNLTVTLSSDDTSEATVPPSVIILAGQASANFTVQAVDDLDIDGTQTPTITASAAGFTDVTATVDVTDDEVVQIDDLEIGLYRADTDQLITLLDNGQVIQESSIPDAPLTIAAIVPQGSAFFGQVESIALDLNNGQVTRIESVEPYALFGDALGNYFGQNDILQIGANNVTFDLYDQNGASGTLLTTISLDFTVDDGQAAQSAQGAAPASSPILPTPIFELAGIETYSGQSSDVDNLAHDPIFEINEGTIAFSFIDDDPSIEQGLVVKDATGVTGGGNHFASYIDDGDLFFRFEDDVSNTTFTLDNINAGQEYEVAAVFGNDGVEVYIDGVLLGEDQNFIMNWESNEQFLQIGGLGSESATGDGAFVAPYSGQIADLQIFDQALEQAEIELLANNSSFDFI